MNVSRTSAIENDHYSLEMKEGCKVFCVKLFIGAEMVLILNTVQLTHCQNC